MPEPDEADELTSLIGLTIERFSIVNHPAIRKKKYLTKNKKETTKNETKQEKMGEGGDTNIYTCSACGYQEPHAEDTEVLCFKCGGVMIAKEGEMPEETAEQKEAREKEEKEKKEQKKQAKYIIPDDVAILLFGHLDAIRGLISLKKATKTEGPEDEQEKKEPEETETEKRPKEEVAARGDEAEKLSDKIAELEKEVGEGRAEEIAHLKEKVASLEKEKQALEKMRGERQGLEEDPEETSEASETESVYKGVLFPR